MRAEEIESCLRELNDELRRAEVKGEICLYGGAVMCLVYKARPATKDVDAIFEPTSIIREAVIVIAQRHGLREDWLNDGVKGFVRQHETQVFLELSHLTVYVPSPDYLLAMKCLAARSDTDDPNDVRVLCGALQLTTAEQAMEIVRRYYPREEIKPATRFFIEEIFGS